MTNAPIEAPVVTPETLPFARYSLKIPSEGPTRMAQNDTKNFLFVISFG